MAIVLIGLGAAPAAAQVACGIYEIQAGDTLRAINLRAYGNDQYQQLHDANRIVIGPTPHKLELGQVIRLPCQDGSLPPGTEGDAILALQKQTPSAAPAVTTPTELRRNAPVVPRAARATHSEIRLLTAGDLLPFVDQNRRGGGLVPELIDKAMSLTAPEQPYRVDFVNDRRAQLEVLIPLGAFDLTFPWFRPDCSRGFDLSARDQILCDDYAFSDPIYSVATAFFADRGDPNRLRVTGLVRGRVCIPGDYIGPDPLDGSLVDPLSQITTARDTLTCLRGIGTTTDYVLTNPELVGTQERTVFAEIPGQTREHELAVAALKSNADAVARLGLLDAGLKQVTGSSEWRDVVASEIEIFRKRL